MLRREARISGTIIYGEEFEPRSGYLVIGQGRIKEIGEEKVQTTINGIILPSFVNVHTHVGDSIAKEPDKMPIEQLVGPGGFKHTILAETPYEMLVSAMRDTIEDLCATGTQLFVDFREGGITGVNALRDALRGADTNERLQARILGRPGSETVDEGELDKLFEVVDGIGVSSVADYPREAVHRLAEEARRRRKLFALHAGERNADDIRDAIELGPDFIVHLINATPRDFRQMRDQNIGAVVCIRSNLVTGLGLPQVRQMFEAGLTVGAGTDNVMLNSPDMLAEMEFISKVTQLDDRDVLKMCTLNPAKILGEEESIGTIEEGKRANVVVIRTDTPNMRNVRDPLRGVVRRATRNDISAVIYEGRVVFMQ